MKMPFINDETIVFAYSLTEHAVFSLKTMATADITFINGYDGDRDGRVQRTHWPHDAGSWY